MNAEYAAVRARLAAWEREGRALLVRRALLEDGTEELVVRARASAQRVRTIARPAFDLARAAARLTDERRAAEGLDRR